MRRWYLLLAIACLAGCGRKPVDRDEPPPPGPVPAPPEQGASIDPEQVEPAVVSLWFAHESLEFLECEVRDVPEQKDDPSVLASVVVDALLAGPLEPGHTKVLPDGVRNLGVAIADGTCTVDLSGELKSKFNGGSNVADLAVYSIVNSLCELDGVERVLIKVDGQPGGEFAGVLDLNEPLTADDKLNGAEEYDPAAIEVEAEPHEDHP